MYRLPHKMPYLRIKAFKVPLASTRARCDAPCKKIQNFLRTFLRMTASQRPPWAKSLVSKNTSNQCDNITLTNAYISTLREVELATALGNARSLEPSSMLFKSILYCSLVALTYLVNSLYYNTLNKRWTYRLHFVHFLQHT